MQRPGTSGNGKVRQTEQFPTAGDVVLDAAHRPVVVLVYLPTSLQSPSPAPCSVTGLRRPAPSPFLPCPLPRPLCPGCSSFFFSTQRDGLLDSAAAVR